MRARQDDAYRPSKHRRRAEKLRRRAFAAHQPCGAAVSGLIVGAWASK